MLCKIIYFDEESITDFIQISEGGELEKTTQLLKESGIKESLSIGGGFKIGLGRIVAALSGANAYMDVKGDVSAEHENAKMIKSIIKNTILTDFLDILDKRGSGNKSKRRLPSGAVKKFQGYEISIEKDSMAYMAMVSPYLNMVDSGTTVDAGDFNIAVEKLDNTIKSAKGYYELIGQKGKERVVLRFNINAFKNNYSMADLLKMDLSIYAIKVGKTTIDQLNISNEFDLDADNKDVDNPSYDENELNEAKNNSNDVLDVFDVLLAGVESNDK